MSEKINELIKSVKDLKYDASTGTFETDRRALFDFAELIVQECAKVCRDQPNIYAMKVASDICATSIEEHFGVAN
jgi:hypothetical protein